VIAHALARALLAGNPAAAIRAAVAQYAGAAAVFTTRLPADSPLPAILIQDVAGAASGIRAKRGALCEADNPVFGDKNASSAAVAEIARALWLWADRLDLSAYLVGMTCAPCTAQPPANTQDGLGFPGYTIRVQANLMEV
jgi:hypothetical protein